VQPPNVTRGYFWWLESPTGVVALVMGATTKRNKRILFIMGNEIYLDSIKRFSSRLNAQEFSLQSKRETIRILMQEITNVFDSELTIYFPLLGLKDIQISENSSNKNPTCLFMAYGMMAELAGGYHLTELSLFLSQILQESKVQLLPEYLAKVNTILRSEPQFVNYVDSNYGALNLISHGTLLFQDSKISDQDAAQVYLSILVSIFKMKNEVILRSTMASSKMETLSSMVELSLSPRQIEIIIYLQKEYTISQVSKDMGYSESLIKKELAQIYRKLEVDSKRELIRKIESMELNSERDSMEG